jgi:predicted transcriptional regulator
MTKGTKVLRIGIATRQEMRARTIAIARGDHRPGPNEPKVWFTSLESLAQVLSGRNRHLLETIQRARPASMKELARISGRAESNLSRTLHTMARYGLVRLNRAHGRIVPEVPYDRLELGLPIGA